MLGAIHTALDLASFVPGLATVTSLANAAIYVAEGNYADAALSALGAIPLGGQLITVGKVVGKAFGKYGKYAVGAYDTLREGAEVGLDAHHVGQKALMKQFIPGYDPLTAPAILLPKLGHTIAGVEGIVSRSMRGFDSVRQVIARDIRELRRVYPDIPNSRLEALIRMNKEMYPQVRK